MPNDISASDLVRRFIHNRKACSCGRKHVCRLKSFLVAEDRAETLIPGLLDRYGASDVHFISSESDMDRLGSRVFSYLSSLGYRVSSSVFPPESGFICDHVSAGDLLIHVPAQAQVLIAVGEKTVCDLAKFVSSKNRIPLIFLPTSASSDTFSMSEAEFTENDRRIRLALSAPEIIIADLSVLQDAPSDKTGAGLAAILATLVSLADWKLSSVVSGTYFCPVISEALSSSAMRIIRSVENGISPRDRELMRELISCLVLCGISADLAGSSSPIRGSESCIARHAELLLVSEDITGISFETLRGISSLYAVRLYEYLKRAELSFEDAASGFNDIDRVYFHKELFRVFGEDEGRRILSAFGGSNYYQQDARYRRLALLKDGLGELLSSVCSDLPSSSRITALLRSVSVPFSFSDIGLIDEEISDILIWSKELSQNYGITRLLADLLLLEQAVSGFFTKLCRVKVEG